jgi:hypothetical protein
MARILVAEKPCKHAEVVAAARQPGQQNDILIGGDETARTEEKLQGAAICARMSLIKAALGSWVGATSRMMHTMN